MEFRDICGEILDVSDEAPKNELVTVYPYYDGPYWFKKETIKELRDHLNKLLEDASPSPR